MTNVLTMGSWLNTNDMLTAPNGAFFAVMQGDGNFVIYRGQWPNTAPGNSLWATGSNKGPGSYWITMQSDGNLVIYPGSGHPPPAGPPHSSIWASKTQRPLGAQYTLRLDDDGSLKIHDESSGVVIWAASTTSGNFPGPVSDALKSFFPSDFQYDLDHAQILSEATEQQGQAEKLQNVTDVQQSEVLGGSFTTTDTMGWQDQTQVQISGSVSGGVKIPLLADAKLTVTTTVTQQWQTNGSHSQSHTWNWSVPVVAPPHKTVEARALITQAAYTVPYIATGTFQYQSGKTIGGVKVAGTYAGKNGFDLETRVTQDP
jgi:Clostridium epsilon toxin ETX/Bacillus mosquitocidal toxin MTX2